MNKTFLAAFLLVIGLNVYLAIKQYECGGVYLNQAAGFPKCIHIKEDNI